MTYNGQTGAQSWKISGGLNGGTLNLSDDVAKIFNNLSGATLDVLIEILALTKETLAKILSRLLIVIDFISRVIYYHDAGCGIASSVVISTLMLGFSAIISGLIALTTGALLLIPVVGFVLAITWIASMSWLLSEAIGGMDEHFADEFCRKRSKGLKG